MAAGYILALFSILGFIQGEPIPASPAIIEDLRDASSSRVVGGWPAYDTQIPYQVSLRLVGPTGGVSACGGSIIHHQWVLTAAHCLVNRFTFVVRVGLISLTRPDYIVESYDKYTHPGYNQITGGVQTDDVALIGLNLWIPYGPTRQPARLQSSEQKSNDYAGVQLVVSGFGRTDDAWNSGVHSENLLWTFQRGITNEECLSWYTNSQVIKEQTVCAVYYNETSQSSCQGDSGGPLTMVDADGQTTVIGLVSFGSTAGCNSPWPTGYVRPEYYHDWYYEVTGINFDWTVDDLNTKPIQRDYENLDGQSR